MAKPKTYRKLVLQPGVYRSRTMDGKRVPVEITAARLKKMAETVKEMNADGLLIPAPYEHDFTAKPLPSSGREAFANVGGFFKDAEFDESTGRFSAIIEVASTEDEAIVGKKVKGLSLWTQDKYEAPNGKTYFDAPMHLALTNKPMAVHAGEDQEWSELPEESLALCMSDMVGEDPIGDLSALRELLKKVAKVALPEEATSQTLVSALMAALMQKELSEADDEDGSVTKPPKDAEEASAPIIMSEEDRMTKELEEKVASLLDENNKLKKLLLDQERATLASRVDALIMSDVSVDYAKKLKAEIVNAEPAVITILSAKVEALEAVPKPVKKTNSAQEILMSDLSNSEIDGFEVPNPLLDMGDVVTPERQDAIVKEMLQYIS